MQPVDKPTQISQFSIRTLLWLTLVAAAFLGGMQVERMRQPAAPFNFYVGAFR